MHTEERAVGLCLECFQKQPFELSTCRCRSHTTGMTGPAAASRNGGGASSYARSDGGSSPKGDAASDLASSEILATPTQGPESRPFRSQSGALSNALEGQAPGGSLHESMMLDLPPILTGAERGHEPGDSLGARRMEGVLGGGSTHSPATSGSSQRGLPPTASQRPKVTSVPSVTMFATHVHVQVWLGHCGAYCKASFCSNSGPLQCSLQYPRQTQPRACVAMHPTRCIARQSSRHEQASWRL